MTRQNAVLTLKCQVLGWVRVSRDSIWTKKRPLLRGLFYFVRCMGVPPIVEAAGRSADAGSSTLNAQLGYVNAVI